MPLQSYNAKLENKNSSLFWGQGGSNRNDGFASWGSNLIKDTLYLGIFFVYDNHRDFPPRSQEQLAGSKDGVGEGGICGIETVKDNRE